MLEPNSFMIALIIHERRIVEALQKQRHIVGITVRVINEERKEKLMQNQYWQSVYYLNILVLILLLAGCRDKAPKPDAVAMSVPTSSTQQHNTALSSSTTVNVVATDFAFALEPTTASAGAITFLVTNKGQMPHDFALQNGDMEVKTAMLAPGETGSITVDLALGSYSYVCTVPGHNILGMSGTFTVE